MWRITNQYVLSQGSGFRSGFASCWIFSSSSSTFTTCVSTSSQRTGTLSSPALVSTTEGLSTPETNWHQSLIQRTNCCFVWQFVHSIWDQCQFVSGVDAPSAKTKKVILGKRFAILVVKEEGKPLPRAEFRRPVMMAWRFFSKSRAGISKNGEKSWVEQKLKNFRHWSNLSFSALIILEPLLNFLNCVGHWADGEIQLSLEFNSSLHCRDKFGEYIAVMCVVISTLLWCFAFWSLHCWDMYTVAFWNVFVFQCWVSWQLTSSVGSCTGSQIPGGPSICLLLGR